MPGPPPDAPELPSSLEARALAVRYERGEAERPPVPLLPAARSRCTFQDADGRPCMLDYGHKGDHGL